MRYLTLARALPFVAVLLTLLGPLAPGIALSQPNDCDANQQNDPVKQVLGPVQKAGDAPDPFVPFERVLRAQDQAQTWLNGGQVDRAMATLKEAADDARKMAKADPAKAAVWNAIADVLEAKAKALGETAPDDARQAASALARASRDALTLAQSQTDPHIKDLLTALSEDGRITASLVAESATNTEVLIGKGISQTYRRIVAAAFDKKINDVGWISNKLWDTKADLRRQKARVLAVFDELDRTIEREGVSFDRAWSLMFNDNYILRRGSPLLAHRYATRNHAAATLRDHDVTSGLLAPFGRLSDALSSGDAKSIDEARAKIVEVLREKRQWGIANAVLDELKEDARSSSGRERIDDLVDNASSEYWKQAAGDFVAEDLPILVLSGLVSGGIGWGARGGAAALGWSTRAGKIVQTSVGIATFVPTERVLNDVINGKAGDWSAGGLARDYALTLAGYGLFRAAGHGWKYVKGRYPRIKIPSQLKLKPGQPLPDDEIIIIGSNNKPGNFILRAGIDDVPIGKVTQPGKSGTIAQNLEPATEIPRMFGRAPKRGDIMSGTSVSDIRAAGFDVVYAPTLNNPYHVRIVPAARTFDEAGREWLSAAFDRLARIQKVR